jgi:hypothetical protein
MHSERNGVRMDKKYRKYTGRKISAGLGYVTVRGKVTEGHFWSTLLQQYELGPLLENTVATV